jgi:hypothetical protein
MLYWIISSHLFFMFICAHCRATDLQFNFFLDAEAEQRENDSYLFDLENREGDTFCIDANKVG